MTASQADRWGVCVRFLWDAQMRLGRGMNPGHGKGREEGPGWPAVPGPGSWVDAEPWGEGPGAGGGVSPLGLGDQGGGRVVPQMRGHRQTARSAAGAGPAGRSRAHLPEAHAVGLLPDLRQPQPLLHFAIPEDRAPGSQLGQGTPSPPCPPSLLPAPHLRPPRFLRCPSRGAGSGFTCFTGGGSCHLSNFRSISSLSS